MSAARETRDGQKWRFARWALLIGFLAAIIAFTGQPSPLGQGLAATGIAVSVGLAIWVHGWPGCALLAAVCLVLTFGLENIGVATGFPFGRYHFAVGAGLPHIGAIPIIVGPLYFGVGYLAWTIAGVLLDEADAHLDRQFNLLALPLAAAFVMVQWDLVMDPSFSTLDRAWVWRDAGGYFGTPLSNYAGWFLTVWLVFQAFALMIRRWPALFARPAFRSRKEVQWMAALLYLAIALSRVAPYLSAPRGGVAVDPTGWAWRISDIREAAVVIMAFSMAPTAILTMLRLARPTSKPTS